MDAKKLGDLETNVGTGFLSVPDAHADGQGHSQSTRPMRNGRQAVNQAQLWSGTVPSMAHTVCSRYSADHPIPLVIYRQMYKLGHACSNDKFSRGGPATDPPSLASTGVKEIGREGKVRNTWPLSLVVLHSPIQRM